VILIFRGLVRQEFLPCSALHYCNIRLSCSRGLARVEHILRRGRATLHGVAHFATVRASLRGFRMPWYVDKMSPEALTSAVAGFSVGGIPGAIVAGAIGNSARPDGAEGQWYLPQLAGVVMCVTMPFTGPAAAAVLAATAAGGSYLVKLPTEEKVALAAAVGRSLGQTATAAGKIIGAWIRANGPQLRLTYAASTDSAAALNAEAIRAAKLAKATAALEEDAFALHPLDDIDQADEWAALQKLLYTDPKKLGYGKDVKGGKQYNKLRVASAWRIEHPSHHARYAVQRDMLAKDMDLLMRKGTLKHDAHREGMPTRTAHIEEEAALEARLGAPNRDVNETVKPACPSTVNARVHPSLTDPASIRP
jgi:hypothetical protein